jgi:hypothetical protein
MSVMAKPTLLTACGITTKTKKAACVEEHHVLWWYLSTDEEWTPGFRCTEMVAMLMTEQLMPAS